VLDDPGPGEVLVRMEYGGLCHSDAHGGGPVFPSVGGHEGAGVVERVGEGVTRVRPGDHVAASWIPACGRCRWCATGQARLCDMGALMRTGELARGGFRFSDGTGRPYASKAGVATFAAHSVIDERSVVPVDPEVPLEWAALMSCGVATGWGSVVNAGALRPGESVVVYGMGGIGVNAVRAAVSGGAGLVAVVDPVAAKRQLAAAEGVDLVFETAHEAQDVLWERTGGIGMDLAVLAAGIVDAPLVSAAFALICKGGRMVLTGVSGDLQDISVRLPGSLLTLYSKRIVGSLFGDCVPQADIPRLLALAKAGALRVDDLVTSRYRLEDINQGFDDLLAGRNLRGMVRHEH
jgi:alcohol dehydrogenase/S-(hydroxymethyl)glutathione dehydrogenase/alcohol dehydrogenase